MLVIAVGAFSLFAVAVGSSRADSASTSGQPVGTLQAPILLSVEIVPEQRGPAAPSTDCEGRGPECADDRRGPDVGVEPESASPSSVPVLPATVR